MTQTSTLVQPKVGIMIDTENLSLAARGVITQIAMVGWRMDDPTELLDPPVHSFLPIQAQLSLVPSRIITESTLLWWMKQPDDARKAFEQNSTADFEELPSMLRHLIRGFNRMTNDGKLPYEVWARGPQMDIAQIESLLQECGLEAPWKYDKVRDLRTLMATAGVSVDDVEEPAGFVAHDAYWDCRFQISCFAESIKQLRAR